MELISKPVIYDGLFFLYLWPGNCNYYYRLLIGYWILATAWISIWAFLFSVLRSQ